MLCLRLVPESTSVHPSPSDGERDSSYDPVILGGGAAAFAAAIRADKLGRTSAVVNADLPIGGTGANVGCIPPKILLEAGNEYFWRPSPLFACNLPEAVRRDFPETIAHKDRMVPKLRRVRKMVADAKTRTLAGVHIVAPWPPTRSTPQRARSAGGSRSTMSSIRFPRSPRSPRRSRSRRNPSVTT